jgi:pimeloyl-ACP methyl ester carboxylesterase
LIVVQTSRAASFGFVRRARGWQDRLHATDSMPSRVAKMSARAAQREAAQWPARRAIKMWEGEVSTLAWEQAGAKAASVHFAHANGFNAQTYRSLLDPLADEMRVYASDLRGHGQTTLAANPKGMRSWRIYRDDMLRLVQELDGKPQILAGHSMGATVSLIAALTRPNWVTGLVLVEPVILPQRFLRWMRLVRALGLVDWAFPMVAQAKRRRGIWPTREAMFQAYRGKGAFRSWPEEIVRDYVAGGSLDYIDDRQVRLACTPGWEAANYRAVPPDVWPEIGKLQCPMTLIVGGRRSTCPEPVIEELVAARPDIRVVSVPGASHFLPMECPSVVRSEIRGMASRISEDRYQVSDISKRHSDT